jgi:hypothetical protein
LTDKGRRDHTLTSAIPGPRFGVHFSDPFLNLSITNHGPIACTITHAVVEVFDPVKRKKQRGLINPLINIAVSIEDTEGPFTHLPKKIEVGEEFSLRFWSGENAFLEKEVIQVGVTDTFSREHWCTRRQVKKVQADYFKMRQSDDLPKLSRNRKAF